jgi:ubiquinone/menaquinone biosynthesis C-methylase UbiE
MTIDKNKYTQMQKSVYEFQAQSWSPDNRDPVVGSFDEHNAWKDYDDFLFKGITTEGKLALDFGCGPGRNIVKFYKIFSKIDGVDISQNNIENAKIWIAQNNIAQPNLYVNNGVDLSVISGDSIYDVIFSTICIQHICVHDIRMSLLKDFYRLLKPGGSICIQMGFGARINSSGYYDNNYEAIGTNSWCDTRVEDPKQLETDLVNIGYNNFNYDIRPVGPGDKHQNWIFFRASK